MSAPLSAGVEAITGKFGGGKSYNATAQMIAHFRRGGTCCGNVALNWPQLKEEVRKRYRLLLRDEQWIPLEDHQVTRFYDFIPASADPAFPVEVYLDECAIFFNANEWAKVTPQFRAFLPQPRKYGVRLVWIIQNFERMLKEVREYVPVKHAYRDASKLSAMGIDFSLKVFGCELLPYFIHSVYDYKQRKDAKPLRTKWLRKEPWIYRCYDSYHLHGDAPELRKVGKVALEKQPLFSWLWERVSEYSPGLVDCLLLVVAVVLAVIRW